MKSKSGLCLLVLALSGTMQPALADHAVAAISQNFGIGMAMRFQRQANFSACPSFYPLKHCTLRQSGAIQANIGRPRKREGFGQHIQVGRFSRQ